MRWFLVVVSSMFWLIGPVEASPLKRSWAVRMVLTQNPDPRPFTGITLRNLAELIFSEACNECWDSFRKDDIVIWSSAAGTQWRILPPRRFGAALLASKAED